MYDCLCLEQIEIVEQIASMKNNHVHGHRKRRERNQTHHNCVIDGVQPFSFEIPRSHNTEVDQHTPSRTHHNSMDQGPIGPFEIVVCLELTIETVDELPIKAVNVAIMLDQVFSGRVNTTDFISLSLF